MKWLAHVHCISKVLSVKMWYFHFHTSRFNAVLFLEF